MTRLTLSSKRAVWRVVGSGLSGVPSAPRVGVGVVACGVVGHSCGVLRRGGVRCKLWGCRVWRVAVWGCWVVWCVVRAEVRCDV